MNINLKSILAASFIAFLFMACSNKEVNPYDEIFSDKHKFVPINTKELKEVK